MASRADLLLASLDLPPTLQQRILCRVSPHALKPQESDQNASPPLSSSFVLYLPTVVLRKRHNPAFALACRLANHHQVPLLVLVTVLDDQHLSQTPLAPLTQTARRLAFVVEALQSCCPEWEDHGAGVAIRVLGPGARTPHHLTLAHQANVVITDEPFVEPYRTYVKRIVKTCRSAKVPCFSVDGSTTVPPAMKLKPVILTPNATGNIASGDNDDRMNDMGFSGAPHKAWKWEEQTRPHRKTHVNAACHNKALDAPEMVHKLPANFFLSAQEDLQPLLARLPSNWKDNENGCCRRSAPGRRPWTVEELVAIQDAKQWAMTSWQGADVTVLPCRQTHGSQDAALQRWKAFVESGRLKDYAKTRNRVSQPHSVSRISCYLNLGILSIFDVILDVWQAQDSKSGYATGAQKFLDELVKFREGSYVHCFSTPHYHTQDVLPTWARRHLNSMYNEESNGRGSGFSYKQLERASTGDDVWDAMQGYLNETGELHNNARMSWGKTVVHWQARNMPANEMLWQLVCLNDRYALDGLSPPSYFGLLWCAGFQDKPADRYLISTKWASQYRQGAAGFAAALTKLYVDPSLTKNEPRIERLLARGEGNDQPVAKKARRENTKTKAAGSILSYFSPAKAIG